MQITFWGVRGSIPTPGATTEAVGGNTSCVEIQAGPTRLIFDGGTGLRLLGKKLLGHMPVTAHMFFSHVHWDHIQGFPFFEPAFVSGNTFHLYGARKLSRTLEETLAGQMDHPNFPVHLSAMGATMTFRDLVEGEIVEIDNGTWEPVRVTSVSGNHPQGVLAFRVECGEKAAVYATDTEHYDGRVDENLVRLSEGADVLIYDSQYTPEEYAGTAKGVSSKRGWGHSTFEEGAKIARLAGASRLVLFHHDPGHDDAFVHEKELRAQELFPSSVAAREGMSLAF